MFCPICGQQQITDDIRFCARCGFPLAGVSDLILNGGSPLILQPKNGAEDTPRRRGVKKGLMIFLLTFLVVPLVALITIFLHGGPFPIALAALLLAVGGLLRMAYAVLLESNQPGAASLEESIARRAKTFKTNSAANSLPPANSISAHDYIAPKSGVWRDTNDLAPSVVDNTTRQLRDERES